MVDKRKEKITCAWCDNEAVYDVGIPDPDLPMIPACEKHKHYLYVYLNADKLGVNQDDYKPGGDTGNDS